MIHILLLVLEIIGIILLAVLVLALLILFYPVMYNAKVQSEDGVNSGRISANWLCRIVSFKTWFVNDNVFYRFKIFGITVFRSKKDKKTNSKESKSDKKSSSNNNSENKKTSDNIKNPIKSDDTEQQNFINRNLGEQDNAEQSKISNDKKYKAGETNKSELFGDSLPSKTYRKKKDFKGAINRFKTNIINLGKNIIEVIKNIYKDINGYYNKLKQTNELVKKASTKEAYRYAKKYIIKICKHILPRRIKAQIHFGFDEPYLTGRSLGYIAMAYATFNINPKHFHVTPEFEKKILEGKIKFRGHFMLGIIGIYLLKLYFKKEIRNIIDKFR